MVRFFLLLLAFAVPSLAFAEGGTCASGKVWKWIWSSSPAITYNTCGELVAARVTHPLGVNGPVTSGSWCQYSYGPNNTIGGGWGGFCDTAPPPPPPDPCLALTGNPLTTPDLSVPVSGAHVTPSTVCETVSSTGGPNGGPLLCGMSYTNKPDGMWAQSPDGKWYFFVYSATEAAKYKYTGASCTDSASGGGGSGSGSGTNSAPAPTPTTCASGTCPGTVNGTNVCVPCSGAADEGPKETTTNTDTSGNTTPGETKDSAVTCDGNYCTIKTTSTNPDGSYSTSTKTQDKKSYCEENPTFPACTARWVDEECDKEQKCEGDPIACAQAKLAKKTYCENFVRVTPLTEIGTDAANGENYPDGHPRSDATTSAFNFAGAFASSSSGGGGCPADVTVMGVVVPLSSTCDGLNGLGIAALGIALIWAARVVFGG